MRKLAICGLCILTISGAMADFFAVRTARADGETGYWCVGDPAQSFFLSYTSVLQKHGWHTGLPKDRDQTPKASEIDREFVAAYEAQQDMKPIYAKDLLKIKELQGLLAHLIVKATENNRVEGGVTDNLPTLPKPYAEMPMNSADIKYLQDIISRMQKGMAQNEKLLEEINDRLFAAYKAGCNAVVDGPGAATAGPIVVSEPLVVNGDARLIWEMELAGKVTVDGSVRGESASFHFTGKIVEPAEWSGTVTCEGARAHLPGPQPGASVNCNATIPNYGVQRSSTWTTKSNGSVNFDGYIFKGLGRGTRADSGGGNTSFPDLGVVLNILPKK